MSDFAEWRPCRVCGLPVALPQRVHDACAEMNTMSMTVKQVQVIHFTFHNPHAENVRCCVMIPDDASGLGTGYSRCPEVAEWGMLEPMRDRDTRYAMTAYCKRHFVIASQAVVE